MLKVPESIGYSFERLDRIVDPLHHTITEASTKEIQYIIFPLKTIHTVQ
jgi:hypothetical protein